MAACGGDRSRRHRQPQLGPQSPARVAARIERTRSGHVPVRRRFHAAEQEIAVAAEYIRRTAANPSQRLFAYPYGEAGRYLVDEYFPAHAARIGVDAAFTTAGEPITEASDRWRLPRYTCGQHWTTPEELRALLHDIAA